VAFLLVRHGAGKEFDMPKQTIEASDVSKVAYILLRMVEQDRQPITITKNGEPYVVLQPIGYEQGITESSDQD
jgi:prevent-host-death family protein